MNTEEEISLVDFSSFPMITNEDKENVTEYVSSLLKSFTTQFTKLTDKTILCSLFSLSSLSYNDTESYIKEHYSPFYTKCLNDNKDELFISLNPSFVDSSLINAREEKEETIIKKNIATHFVLDPLKTLITKNPNCDYKESSSIFQNKRFLEKAPLVIVELSTVLNDIENKKSILIASSLKGWQKLTGKKISSFSLPDYKTHNAFAFLTELNLNEEHISSLKVGERIPLPPHCFNNENIPFIINKKLTAVGTTVEVKDNKVSLLLRPSLAPSNEDYITESRNNLFVILGSKEIKEEEEIKENEVVTFDSSYRDDYPLVYKKKIIAYVTFLPGLINNYIKVTRVIEDGIILPLI